MNEYVWVLFLIGAGLSSWSAYLGTSRSTVSVGLVADEI